jgi:predicted acyltransferase
MILGLIAGRWLRESAKQSRFWIAGAAAIAAGLLLHVTGLCPIVKRIWTPSWVLFSGGICFWLTSAFHWVIEIKNYRKWAFPLVVIGMNSIAAYLIAHLFEDFIASSLKIHFSERLAPVHGALILTGFWLILLWMYKRKLFLKV